MGIGYPTLNQFIQFKKEGIFDQVKSIMDFGSQEIFCEGEEQSLKNFFDAFGVHDVSLETLTRISRRGSAREVYEKLGFTYNCIDVDGQFGALTLDLNFEDVPEDHSGKYDFVTNFGTTEHIANQMNCFKVMHDLTKPGGYMYHELICTGMLNHGLVNYNPKMFWMLCKCNFYDYVGMWFTSDANPEKLPENIVQMCRPINPETLNRFSTHSSMIGVLIRKVFDVPFVPPLDGDLSGTTDEQKARYWTVTDPQAYEKISHLRYHIDPVLPEGNYLGAELTEARKLRLQLAELTEARDLNLELAEAQAETERLSLQLSEARNEIEAMKTSKFWKLRTQWFKFKQKFGLSREA